MQPGTTLYSKSPHIRGNAIIMKVFQTDNHVRCAVLSENGKIENITIAGLKARYKFGPVKNIYLWIRNIHRSMEATLDVYLSTPEGKHQELWAKNHPMS